MASDTDQAEPVGGRIGWTGQAGRAGQPERAGGSEQSERLRDLVAGARLVLWDFDGPVCRLFAGYSADRVAAALVDWLEKAGLKELLPPEERDHPDPHVLLGAVHRSHPKDLVDEFEERLTREELRAVPGARPTAYADPLIRAWAALGVGLAITTNNSPRAVREYLATRGLLGCFAPHIYGRTQDPHLLKPDPYCLDRALDAMRVPPAKALMIGDSPADVAAARKAGVPFLGYARNDRKAEQLRAAGAPVLVDSLEAVLGVVRR
ncbi:hydrolase [Streptomyces geysiriensis]|uniref:HAD family hydrolase n=1 Tax=Streptomyces TaxID=1883 RepID=UPI0019A8FF55|nr:HAD family hydrolase [Streptomyces sp. WAC06128]GGY63700.1 hydrolase [Streptomyces geysiriensis]